MRTEAEAASATIVLLGRMLRERGVGMGPGQLARCRASLAWLDPADARDLYWAGRACLINGEQDVGTYDEVFAELFLAARTPTPAVPRTGDRATEGNPPRDGDARPTVRGERLRDLGTDEAGGNERDQLPIGGVASPVEVLRHKSFAECSPEETAQIHRLLRSLPASLPQRRTHRTRPGQPAHRLDLRKTVRRSMRNHGEFLRREWRRRATRPRSLVLLLDVSGSMTGYTRALLQFGHAVAATGGPVEVFCFGTRLTRVTRLLRVNDPDFALSQAADAVLDWDGGTRIGESLRELLSEWGGRSALRRAVVVVCSDGLERGDPALLGRQMARLSRIAFRIVWVNPLAGSAGYEPATRGMQATMPHIDDLVAGDTLSGLERLATLLARLRGI